MKKLLMVALLAGLAPVGIAFAKKCNVSKDCGKKKCGKRGSCPKKGGTCSTD